MKYWDIEHQNGVIVAGYKNPPTNYLVADATIELASLIESWRAPEVRAVWYCPAQSVIVTSPTTASKNWWPGTARDGAVSTPGLAPGPAATKLRRLFCETL